MNPKVALTFELHPAFVARKAVGIANAGAGVQDQLRAVRKQHLLAFAIRGRGFQIRNLLFVDVIQISDATQHQTKNRSCSDSCHAAKPGPFFVLDALQQLARLFLRLLAFEVSQRLLRRWFVPNIGSQFLKDAFRFRHSQVVCQLADIFNRVQVIQVTAKQSLIFLVMFHNRFFAGSYKDVLKLSLLKE